MDLKVVKELFFEIPISSLIVCSYQLLESLDVWLPYDYILQINLTKRKMIWEWFNSLLMNVSNQNWCRIDKKQWLSSAMSKIIKKDPVLSFIVRNGYSALPIIALMPMKQYTVFRCFLPLDDKTNKMSVRPAKTQISLGIRPVWSESSLRSAWASAQSDQRLRCALNG